MKKYKLLYCVIGILLSGQLVFAQSEQPLEVYLVEKIKFDGSTEYSKNLLKSKLERMFSKHEKIVLSGKDAPFKIIPSINIIDKEVITTAPPMIAFKMELSLAFTTALDEKVFASSSINLRGVGVSDNKAYSNAFSNIRHASQQFESFTVKALEEINDYYNESCDKVIAQAENYISYDNYAGAINLLSRVPFGIEPCHQKTLDLISEAYKGYQGKICMKYIDIARVAISIRDFQSATNVLIKIDPNSPCSDEMKALTGQMGDDVKEQFNRKWTVYENYINNEQELKKHRVDAMKNAFAFAITNNNQGSEEKFLLRDSVEEKEGKRTAADSDNFLQLNIVSPISKKNDGKIYTSNPAQNIYGFVSEHTLASSLTINNQSIDLNEQGVFRFQHQLKLGDNLIEIKLTGNDQSITVQNLTIIKVESKEQNNPPESSLIPIVDQTRVALVIGNSNYEHVAPLKNPTNDANDFSDILTELSFKVTKVIDASYEEMRTSFIDFSRKLGASDVALVFFAGHGLEIDGTNYLVPVDAKIESKQDVEQFTLPIDKILSSMKYANDENLNILILDACRNNPFPTGKRGGGGLARVTPPSGMIIAYATEPGATASDGNGSNGLYTGELIKQMKVSQRIEDVFMNTRNGVEEKTNGGQQPWEEARLKGIFYLKEE